jgi:hypothetical protein
MGTPRVKKDDARQLPQRARWPFDPMQPGDHEPARLPEELERVQKQTGAGEKPRSPDSRKE